MPSIGNVEDRRQGGVIAIIGLERRGEGRHAEPEAGGERSIAEQIKCEGILVRHGGGLRLLRRAPSPRRTHPAGGRGPRRCERGGLRACSEPEGEDELLVPGVAGEHFAVEVFSRVSHRWTAAMLAINPAIGGAHDISPRREDMDAESAVSVVRPRSAADGEAARAAWRRSRHR